MSIFIHIHDRSIERQQTLDVANTALICPLGEKHSQFKLVTTPSKGDIISSIFVYCVQFL